MQLIKRLKIGKFHTYVEYVNKRKINVLFPLALFVFLTAPLPLFGVMQSSLNMCRSGCICNKLKDAVRVRKREKVFVCGVQVLPTVL